MDDGRETGWLVLSVLTSVPATITSSSPAVIAAGGWRFNIFKPRSVGEGAGRLVRALVSGSAYGLMIGWRQDDLNGEPHRPGPFQRRLRSGWCLLPAFEDLYPELRWRRAESSWFPALQEMVGKEYLDVEASTYPTARSPTCLRNHAPSTRLFPVKVRFTWLPWKRSRSAPLEEIGGTTSWE